MTRPGQIPDDDDSYRPAHGHLVLTLDVQYVKERAYVAADLLEWHDTWLGILAAQYHTTQAYKPGFFAAREGPVLLNLVRAAIDHLQRTPDLLIVDGHGTAHFRKAGLACWLGQQTGIPTLGVAKESLLPLMSNPAPEKGSRAPVLLEGDLVGYAVRTVAGINPVFVSAGHGLSQDAAAEVVTTLADKYRNIEPIRRADHAARSLARGVIEPGVTVL